MKLALLPLLLAAALFASSQAEAAEDWVRKGDAKMVAKDYKGAAAFYEKAVQASPKNSNAAFLLGASYANQRKWDKAVAAMELSTSLEPSFEAYHHLGLIHANQGEYEKAAKAFDEALKLSPSSYRAWYELGLLHAANKKYDLAVQAYRRSSELNSRFSDAYLGLGSAYFESGDRTNAAEQVRQLQSLGFNDKAAALEEWLNNKESKRKA